jgi:DNA-binding GntR family transcriptional regulator
MLRVYPVANHFKERSVSMPKIRREKFQETLDKLEMDILIGTYRPRERLIELEVMQKQGITRNAVRNIFKELQMKGLVQHIPNRGIIVSDIETKEAKDLYSMRFLLENHALELVLKNIDDSKLDDIVRASFEFEEAVKRKNFKDMVKANIVFHQTIMNVSGNTILIDMVDHLRNRALVVRHYMWLHSNNVQKSVKDHRDLISAIQERDLEKLRKVNRVHILEAFEQYIGEKYKNG